MALSLAEIRARLSAQQAPQTKQSSPAGDNTIYPHWDIPESTTATLRFLPDADPKNGYFWVERNLIKLTFNGVIGQPDIKRVEVQVPCVEMYGPDNVCPILAEIRPWYKDESLKEMANKYWKKRSYLFQGFVRANPMAEDKAPENPIRRFIISPQIQTIVKSSLLDPEVIDMPTDYVRGLDFHVRKTTKGDYADYSTSSFARRESALTEAEQDAIERYGLFNLSDFLPKKPGEAELKIIKEMFDASVDNRPYDLERWGSYYKPWGLQAPNTNSNNATSDDGDSAKESYTPAKTSPRIVPVQSPQTDSHTEDEEATVTKAAPAVSSAKASDIMALIRARQSNKA